MISTSPPSLFPVGGENLREFCSLWLSLPLPWDCIKGGGFFRSVFYMISTILPNFHIFACVDIMDRVCFV